MSSDNTVDFAGINALSSRRPGYAVARKCLEVQAEAESRDPSLRTNRRVVLHDDAWPWYQGALGEIEVGQMLQALGPEWFVRHSVPIGAGTKDVDHLVIGPAGVFAINTKHHRGAKVWVGDYVVGFGTSTKPYLKASRAEGLDVARRLGAKVDFAVPVIPVIAILNAQSLIDRRQRDSRTVAVIEARRLVAWIRQQPHLLSEAKLGLLRLAAEEPETWHVDPRAADTLRVMPRFERLVEQVGGRIPEPGAPAVVRTPREAGVARKGSSSRRPRVAPSRRQRVRLGEVVGLWLVLMIGATVFLVLRSVSAVPCTPQSPVSCLVTPFYAVVKPLFELAIGIGVVVCIATTLRWIVRRSARR